MHVEVQESTNWIVVKIDGEVVYSDNSITTNIWCTLLQRAGISVGSQFGTFTEGAEKTFMPRDVTMFPVIQSIPDPYS